MDRNRLPRQALKYRPEEDGTLDDRRRDGGTNSTLRTKEQETHLTLNEHDDDDDDDDDDDINTVQLFIKLLVRYLEHFDCLRLGHANRLKSWVGCKILSVCL